MDYLTYLRILEQPGALGSQFISGDDWEPNELHSLLGMWEEVRSIDFQLRSLKRTPAAILTIMMHKLAVGYNKNKEIYYEARRKGRDGWPLSLIEYIHLYVITDQDNRGKAEDRRDWNLQENCLHLDKIWGRPKGQMFGSWQTVLQVKGQEANRISLVDGSKESLGIIEKSRKALHEAKWELKKRLGPIWINEVKFNDWPERALVSEINRGDKNLGKGHMFPLEYTFQARLLGKGK